MDFGPNPNVKICNAWSTGKRSGFYVDNGYIKGEDGEYLMQKRRQQAEERVEKERWEGQRRLAEEQRMNRFQGAVKAAKEAAAAEGKRREAEASLHRGTRRLRESDCASDARGLQLS